MSETLRAFPRALLILIAAFPAPAADKPLRIAGALSRGEAFRKPITPKFDFVLKPNDTGWTISVVPVAACGNSGDWATVVNPPYRNYNALHVDASYGTTAWEAVAWLPREFRFVTTCAGYRQESERLNIVLWPYSFSEREASEALKMLGTTANGQGRFTILDSKVSRAKKEIEGKNYGQIDWLKFEVEITLVPLRRGPGRK